MPPLRRDAGDTGCGLRTGRPFPILLVPRAEVNGFAPSQRVEAIPGQRGSFPAVANSCPGQSRLRLPDRFIHLQADLARNLASRGAKTLNASPHVLNRKATESAGTSMTPQGKKAISG